MMLSFYQEELLRNHKPLFSHWIIEFVLGFCFFAKFSADTEPEILSCRVWRGDSISSVVFDGS